MRFVLFAAVLISTAPAEAQVRAVRFGKLWDGTGKIASNVTVIIEGGLIKEIRDAKARLPAQAELIDLSRYSGIPGMIDVHTHITFYWDGTTGTEPRRQSDRRNPSVSVFLAQENARRTLETGVTTVRDLGSSDGMDFAMRELIAMGKMRGPRILAAGQGIGTRGGAIGVDEIRKQVADRVKSGSDWIKLYASTGGFQNVSGTQTISFDEMKAAVETARASGKKIAIHSYGAAGFRDAVRAGPDSIEHGADVDDDTLREMSARGIFFVPTLDHNRYYIDARQEYRFAPGAEDALRDYIRRNLDTAQRAVKAGVRFAMGSDAVFSMFGQNTRELEWFVKAGLTPQEALKTATTNAAELLGLADKLGKVTPGFAADLVAVQGEPWTDIQAAIHGVRWVMKNGSVVVDKR